MPSAEEIKQRIESGMPGASAEVEDYTGTGDHFRATVSAPQFAGCSRIQQHRLVYEIFGEEIGGPIHALSLKTLVAETAPTQHRSPTQHEPPIQHRPSAQHRPAAQTISTSGDSNVQ